MGGPNYRAGGQELGTHLKNRLSTLFQNAWNENVPQAVLIWESSPRFAMCVCPEP